jgi:hypothetical protein
MATYTGVVADASVLALPSPRLVFTLSEPAVSTTVHIIATKPIYAVISPTGSFTVELTPNMDLRPTTYYSMRLEWLDSGSNYTGVDFPNWKFNAETGGGVIPALLGADLTNIFDVWVGETDNADYEFWYQPSTTILWK